MVININGKSKEVQASTVLDVLKTENIDPNLIAVELNDAMIERDHLASTAVKDGDRVEVLFYMGGGR